MAELKTLDKLAEFKMTNAIQKAASIALASDKDRNQVIAQQLDNADIPKELTKLATCAFNRRLSVFTLAGRSDQDKAQSFPIADASQVCKLRGCQQEMQKTASYKTTASFGFTVSKPMQKVASYQPPKPECTVQQYMKKTQALVDKGAIAFQEEKRDLWSAEASLEHILKTASAQLAKDEKTCNKLATVYGDQFTELFKGKLPETHLKKHAAYAVLPKTFAVQTAQKAMLCKQAVLAKRANFQQLSDTLNKLASYAAQLQPAVKSAILKGQIKRAGGYTLMKDVLGNVASAPVISALNLASGAGKEFNRQLQAFNGLSGNESFKPADALTPTLLATDKYDDTRQAIADVLADQAFKDVPTREIEQSVFGALRSMNQGYKPSMRELLKAVVATRIAAGGRTNQAELASIAQTQQTKAKTQSQLKNTSALQAVKSLSPKEQNKANIAEVLALPDIAAPSLQLKDLTSQLQQYAKDTAAERLETSQKSLKSLEEESAKREEALKLRSQLKYKLLDSQLRSNAGGIVTKLKSNHKNIDVNQLTQSGAKYLTQNARWLEDAMNNTYLDSNVRSAVSQYQQNHPGATEDQAIRDIATMYGIGLGKKDKK